MNYALGDYWGTIPVDFITGKPSETGKATPELYLLKGVRYVVTCKASSGAVLTDGVMKIVTGGDKMNVRRLHCDSEIIRPQLSLVLCTNVLFGVRKMTTVFGAVLSWWISCQSS